MSTRILTLFGEEIVPEPQKPAGKNRGKKGEKNAAEEEAAGGEQDEETATSQPVADAPPAPEAVVTSTPMPMAEDGPSEVTKAPEVNTMQPPATMEEAVIAETMMIDAETTAAPEEATSVPSATKKSRKRQGDDGLIAKPEADIIPEDWNGEKKYYTIGEVAGFFKVNTSHIRFWTNEFKLKVRTTRKGDRLFTPDQVKELRAIYHLVKERGFTLSGARTKLKEQNKRDVTTVDLKTSLQDLRSRLVKLRDQLT